MGEMQSSDSGAVAVAPVTGMQALMRWSVLRWVVTGAAALVFAVLFLGSGESTSAAAPAVCDAAHNYCFATRWGALDNTYSNWWYNNYAPTVFAGFPGAGCALGNFVCDANGNPLYASYSYGWANSLPNNVFTMNGCPVGNFACLGNGFTYANCPAGNFSCLNNLTYQGFAPWYASNYFPFYSTGIYSGNVTIVAPGGNPIKLGPPYRVAETSAPVQVTTTDPQPAPAPAPVAVPVQAPAAPTAPVVTQTVAVQQPAPAQVITSLSAAQQAPVAAPVAVPTTGGGNGTTVQGTSTVVVAAPAVDPGNDDHRG